MSVQFLIHLAFLLAAILLTFVWTANPVLSAFTLQLIAILIILYFLNRFWQKKKFGVTMAIDGLIFTLVSLLLVAETGGLSSPLFFILYILLFGLALLYEPLITLIFSLTLSIFFYPQIENIANLVQIIGLLLIMPIALFFGRQYLKLLEEEQKIRILETKKKSLEKEVTHQEQETLLWLDLAFKEHLSKILEESANMLADLSHLTKEQRERLKIIRQNAKRLLKLGEKLKGEIEG
jgi:signal transduction histidine kinase